MKACIVRIFCDQFLIFRKRAFVFFVVVMTLCLGGAGVCLRNEHRQNENGHSGGGSRFGFGFSGGAFLFRDENFDDQKQNSDRKRPIELVLQLFHQFGSALGGGEWGQPLLVKDVHRVASLERQIKAFT